MVEVRVYLNTINETHGFHAERDIVFSAVPRVGETVFFFDEDVPEASEVECVQWIAGGGVNVHLGDEKHRGELEERRQELKAAGWDVADVYKLVFT